jgi:hypothetical protein
MQNQNVGIDTILMAWKKLTLNPPMSLIELITKETEASTMLTPSSSDVKAFITTKLALRFENEIILPKREMYTKMIYVSTGSRGRFAGTQPECYQIDGKMRVVNNWREMIRDLCELVANENRDNFPKVLDLIRGDRREYFAKDMKYLKVWHRIGETNILVETNLSANNSKTLCDAIAKLFGYESPIKVNITVPHNYGS